jgi:type IV pilus assembly protein PilP
MLLLQGCGSGSLEEVQQWVAEQKRNSNPMATTISEPIKFVPAPYAYDQLTDPFSKDKLIQSLRQEAAQLPQSQIINPELSRRRELLESFPLDAMQMVGSLSRAGKPVAIIKVDKLLYAVRQGQYLGLNYGRVMRITESEVLLRELIEEGAGEWVERAVTLQIQERSP